MSKRPAALILSVALLFLATGIGLVFLGGSILRGGSETPIWWNIGYLFFWLAYFVSLIVLAAYSLFVGFVQRSRRDVMEIVFCVYLSQMMCFASGYLLSSLVGDYNHLVSEYTYYEYAEAFYGAGKALPYTADKRAFRGLEYHLWRPPTDFSRSMDSDSGHHDVPQALAVVQSTKLTDFIQFDSSAVLPSLVEHFYFSVVTVATLGYGDIVPNNLYTKLLVIAQVLSSVLLLAFVLGGPHNPPMQPTGSARG